MLYGCCQVSTWHHLHPHTHFVTPFPPPAQDYNGPRETEGIVTYFKRATGDHVIKATSASDWQSNMEEFPVSVLFVAGDAEEQSNIVQVGTSDMCT
jgi:hypothetical protein